MSNKDRIQPGPFGGRITDHTLIIPGEHAREIDLTEGAVEALNGQRAKFIERLAASRAPRTRSSSTRTTKATSPSR